MRKQKGITLIALVLTIIVLLILAGVTIATLTGENGILSRANEAREETGKAGAKEKVEVEVLGSYGKDGNLDYGLLEENLNHIKGIQGVPSPIKEDNFPIGILLDGYEVSIDIKGKVAIEEKIIYPEDISGANHPELKDGMQAITYSRGGIPQPVEDDTKRDWYSYEETTDEDMTDGGTTNGGNSRWANAMLNGNYYVWIPRYAYKIDNTVTYTSPGGGTSKKIDVQFIGTDITSSNVGTKIGEGYIVHPAFKFGEQELTGIWVGKYETTGNKTTPTILPNEISLRNMQVSIMFSTAQKLSTNNYDAHMMKNIEWGAVAYLAQSKYGRNGTEISVNQCSNYYTGVGAGIGENKIYNSTYTWSDITEKQKYNGEIGKLSSTTGNIYGVYDMSGGNNEYVMGVYGTEGNPTIGSSGFTTFPEEKYYDLYTDADSSNIGDALNETKDWNNDNVYFVSSNSQFFLRGGYYDYTSIDGTFSFYSAYGHGFGSSGFRVCLAVK